MSYRPEGLNAEKIYNEIDVVSAIDLIDKTIDITIEALKNQPNTIKHPDEWIIFIPNIKDT